MGAVKQASGGILLIITALLVVCVIRTLLISPPAVEECQESATHQPISEKSRPLIKRLQQAIKFKTISYQRHDYDRDELTRYVQWIQANYPKLHSSSLVEWELVQNYSLLYHVKGSDASLTPYLLAGHLDVVPVEKEKWNMDAFEGKIIDGYLYGRGTIDVKDLTMAILEATEFLLETGFKPKRSFFIAFGHDEEVQGLDGAQYMAKTIKEKYRKDELLYVLDEGTVILKEMFPTVESNVAMIGVSEKGYLTLKLTARGEVGHSSMATYETAISRLSKALAQFNANAHPSLFGTGPEADMLRSVAPYAAFPVRLVFSNLWLFGPLVSYFLSLKPSSNAFVRTTSAVTMVNGGFKENVLPSEAWAYINHRIHPSSSVAKVMEYNRALINDDSISMEVVGIPVDPHPTAPYDDSAFGYQVIGHSVRQVFGADTAVVPGIMVAATDTRWYLNLTHSVYRFNPVVMKREDMNLFHGHNERINVENYEKIVNYYHHIILLSDSDKLPARPVKDEL